MKRFITLALTLALVFSLAACGAKAPAAPAETPVSESGISEEDYIATWECGDLFEIEIAKVDTGYRVVVKSDDERNQTVFAYDCYFDGESLVSNETGEKFDLLLDDDELISSTTVWSDGATALTIESDGTLTWREFKEDTGKGLSFRHDSFIEKAPSVEDFLEDYFMPVNSWHPGTAGSSLKMAIAACEVLEFAEDEDFWCTDIPAMRDNMLKAYESLSADEQAFFDENFMSIYALIDSCFEDWESNRGVFEDSGTAGKMAALLADPMVKVSWEVLRNHTFTMGNSDGV
ncbi:MAG: hypothetical protein IJL40_00270 [Oscillospiraceae bacterium]|nr:hypothetical protein [Oscillospiraceae bacterium]